MREFLEKNYKDDMNENETIRLAVKSLLEVVQTGAKSTFAWLGFCLCTDIEIALMTGHGVLRVRLGAVTLITDS